MKTGGTVPVPRSPREIDEFVKANSAAAAREVKRIEGKKPKMTTNKAKYIETKRAWLAELEEAREKEAYWKEVGKETERMKREEDNEFAAQAAEAADAERLKREDEELLHEAEDSGQQIEGKEESAGNEDVTEVKEDSQQVKEAATEVNEEARQGEGEGAHAPAKESVSESQENVDNQGNPLNADGTLKVEIE